MIKNKKYEPSTVVHLKCLYRAPCHHNIIFFFSDQENASTIMVISVLYY